MSPISAERCIGGRDLTEPRLSPNGALLVYAVSTTGASSLMLSRLDGTAPRQLTAYPAPRPGRGLGGGCWCWTPDSAAVIYSGADGNLWLQPVPGGQVRRLTDHGPEQTAQAPMCAPDGTAVVYVVDQMQVWMQPLSDAEGAEARRLDDGSADFCFDPYVLRSGEGVMWQAWNVPDMAWDASRIESVNFDSSGRANHEPKGAVQQPQQLPDGTIVSIRDDTGWNNLWIDERPLVDEPFEHAGPTWGLCQRTFAISPDGSQIAFTRNERGFGRLCVVDVATGKVDEIGRGVHGQLSWQGSRLAVVRAGARTPTQIAVYDTDSWERTAVDVGPVSGWEAESLVEPDAFEFPATDGTTLHGRLYPADDETDRLLVWLHGGPTDQWQVTFMPRFAYWRSRGFNIFLPDHRGSTGHGREYQQAMVGRWGELDVDDTIDAIAHAQAVGWGTPGRTVLMGGSAGGFTVLGVIAKAPTSVAAAVVSYPVTDLFDLAEQSHRFERHYTHTLVGPVPPSHDQPGPYIDRSPVHFADRIRTPLLMFHGADDPVVPLAQSRVFATRIVESGGFVELRVYEGEGHGFRQPVNQLDEYRRVGEFLDENLG